MKKVNVVKVAMLGVLSALAVVLMFFVRFPILPIVPFMEYDPGDVVGLIAGFLYGPVEGLIVIIIVALIQGMTVSAGSGWVGIAMHIIASGSYVFVASFVYKKIHTRKGALIALIVSSLCMTLVMIPANLFFTVKFWGFPKQQVVDLLLPGIIPFNLIKAVINSVTTFLIYKPLSRMFDIINARNR